MTGALLQLISLGTDNIFLTNNPSITLFKILYKRHTSFIMLDCFSETKINNNAPFSFKILNNGDLLHKLYLVIDLPNIIQNTFTPNIGNIKSLLNSYDIKWSSFKENNELTDLHDYDSSFNNITDAVSDSINKEIQTKQFYSTIKQSINNKQLLIDKHNINIETEQELYMLSVIDHLLNINYDIGNILRAILVYSKQYLKLFNLNDFITLYFNEFIKQSPIMTDNILCLYSIDKLSNYSNNILINDKVINNNSDVYYIFNKFYSETHNHLFFNTKLQAEFTENSQLLNTLITNFNTSLFDLVIIYQNNNFIIYDYTPIQTTSYLSSDINKEFTLFKLQFEQELNIYIPYFNNPILWNNINVMNNIPLIMFNNLCDLLYDTFLDFNDPTLLNIVDLKTQLIYNHIISKINSRFYTNIPSTYSSLLLILSRESLFPQSTLITPDFALDLEYENHSFLCQEWIVNTVIQYISIKLENFDSKYKSVINIVINLCKSFVSDVPPYSEYINIYPKYYYDITSSIYYQLIKKYRSMFNSFCTNILFGSDYYLSHGGKTIFQSVNISDFFSCLSIPKFTETLTLDTFEYDKISHILLQSNSQIIEQLNTTSTSDIIQSLNTIFHQNLFIDTTNIIYNLNDCKLLFLKYLTSQNISSDPIIQHINNVNVNLTSNLNLDFLYSLFSSVVKQFLPIDKKFSNISHISSSNINNIDTDISTSEIKKTTILKTIKNAITNDYVKYAWVKELGHRIIKKINISINGHIISEFTSELLHFNAELSHLYNHLRGYNIMIGNTPEMYTLSNKQRIINTLYIPIPFWFSNYIENALPLFNLINSDIQINVELESLENLLILEPVSSFKCIPNFKCRLLSQFIYLDLDERIKFTQSTLNYLLNRYEYNGLFTFSYNYLSNNSNLVNINNSDILTHNNSLVSIEIKLNNPTKFFIWYFKIYDITNIDISNWNSFGDPDLSNIIDFMKIKFNDIDRISYLSENYFNVVQPYQISSSLSKGEYLYSFSLFPSELQPSGSANMYLLTSSYLLVCFSQALIDKLKSNSNLRIKTELWGYTHNILQISLGFGGLLFI